MSDARTRRRLHIGNISPQLAEKEAMLTTRLLKFGDIVKPLELHTKPVNDFFFAFADMDLTDKEFEKLKAAFHGITFMGRKLTIAVAKPAFEVALQKDLHRPETGKKVLAKHEGIARARELRIAETDTSFGSNSHSRGPLYKTSLIGANNSSMGYRISAHTTNNLSGNTKNDAPSQSLVGMKSYGSTLIPKGPFRQQYAHLSGGGEVVKGRLRKTVRPAAYFARKEQSLRILVNGELKSYKFHKTKLWGVEKNKTARDLTFEYEDGTWKSGDGHAVERVEVKRARVESLGPTRCAISGADAVNYGAESIATTAEVAESSDTTSTEQSKNKTVLAKLFNTFDFDKKVDVEEALEDEEDVSYDSKGRKTVKRFDFETQGTAVNVDSDEEPVGEAGMELVDSYKTSHERPSEFTYYSEDDEGNDMDVDELAQHYTTESIKAQYDGEHQDAESPEKNTKESEGESSLSNSQYESATSNAQVEEEENKSADSELGEEEEESKSEDSELDEEEEENKSEDSELDEEEEENKSEDSELDEKESDSEEEDLIPTFGPAPTSTTENLRSLFSKDTEEKEGLAIELDEEDVDQERLDEEEEERIKLQTQIEVKKKEYQSALQTAQLKQKKDMGLFWTHLDSPFLQQQTQLSKLGSVDERVVLPGEGAEEIGKYDKGENNDDYEAWFWAKRSDANKFCKQRKKDLTRKTNSRKAFI
ncbi:hypothetical protein PUMCH_001754 [Australozyma saopauloensis]|uniref:RRM domain-containing protein n=1 Tax=Australozyma saopauloensis TaxID=291208 RepID=A0AAX4H9V8_9ASCO|nr:hypothetical protein PUMCH_001754 [[Candida] saopauloensis]